MLNWLIVFVFPFLMAYAAWSDLLSMTIANRVSILLAIFFIPAALLAQMPLGDIGLHLAVGLISLTLTIFMFSAGWMGGGDAKLLAATTIWFGPTPLLLEYLILGAFYGALLTISLLYIRAQVAPATGVTFVDRLLHSQTGIPYGIALGIAGLTVYSHSIWMDLAISRLF